MFILSNLPGYTYGQTQKSSAMTSDFTLGTAHSLQKVRRDGANLDTLQFPARIHLDAARDEGESFQVVVIPSQNDLHNVKVTVDALSGPQGQLPVRWHRVEYVKTGNPSYKVEYVGWWPDPLMPSAPFDVPAERVQPLWFTIDVPPDAKPGVYHGTVAVETTNCSKSIPITMRVRNIILPRPGTLALPFGLYKGTLSKWYGQDIDIATYAQWCEFLGKYRITPKNIGYEFVQRSIKKLPSGEKVLEVNMDALQQTVGKLADKYFAPHSYGLYRLPSAPHYLKGPEAQRSNWDATAISKPVITYFNEWKKQGFPDEVYIYGVDEPVGDDFLTFLNTAYQQIKESVPQGKIMQTIGGTAPQLAGLVDIWCPKTTAVRKNFYKERRKAGDVLWNYICVSPVPPCANFFIDEPAIDHRILFWQTKKVQATGLLYWSTTWYNSITAPASGEPAFPDVPMDMRQQELFTNNWVSVNGDGLLIYPGKETTPLPSIRLEVIRDGVEDYEYITLLEQLVEKVEALPKYQTPKGETVIQQAKQLCRIPETISRDVDDFTKEPQIIFNRRKEIGDMIEQLVHILEVQDWKKWK